MKLFSRILLYAGASCTVLTTAYAGARQDQTLKELVKTEQMVLTADKYCHRFHEDFEDIKQCHLENNRRMVRLVMAKKCYHIYAKQKSSYSFAEWSDRTQCWE